MSASPMFVRTSTPSARVRASRGLGRLPRARSHGLGQPSSIFNYGDVSIPPNSSGESYELSTPASADTYTGAVEQEIYNPLGTTYEAGSQLYSDLTSSSPVSDLAQNLTGSLSQSQVDSLVQSCVSGVEQAGGSDSGQCASLVDSAVAASNATPVGSSLSSIPSWVWYAVAAIGAFMIYELMS